MTRISSRRAGFAAAAAAMLAGTPALAHHSFAMFDMSQEKTISGTVSDFQWTNPHSWIWLDVPTAGGGSEKWGVEGMSPNFLERRGWSKNTLKVGDKVSVVIHPVKNGDKGGSFVRVTLPDGKVMDMMGGGYPPASSAPAQR
jgi:hypothetical protein